MNRSNGITMGFLEMARVTPVIETLFGPFGVGPESFNGGELFVRAAEEEDDRSWDRILADLEALAEKSGIALVGAVTADSGWSAARIATLRDLAAPFMSDEEARLDEVFGLALALDDGHGLIACRATTTGGFSRLYPFGQGREGLFVGRHVSSAAGVHDAFALGERLEAALSQNCSWIAAEIIIDKLSSLLDGVRDASAREALRAHIGRRLVPVAGDGDKEEPLFGESWHDAPSVAIHEYPSSGDAYDACQCDSAVRTGDVLLIRSERVVGVAGTWPFAVSAEHGKLHQAVDRAKLLHDFPTMLAAESLAKGLGWGCGPEVIYLTNACGEETGHGSVEVTQSDLEKIPFESGPGSVLPYLVEIGGRKYVLGNLEIAYADEFWGDDGGDFEPESVVRAHCQAICEYIGPRLADGMLLRPLDEDDPGRIAVQVAIPLDRMESSAATSAALERVFGETAGG